jgi:hypothetical protein
MGRGKSTGSRVTCLQKGKMPTFFVPKTLCAEMCQPVVSPIVSEMYTLEYRQPAKKAVWW